jgi:1,4-dihydroxy-2-naphthoate octaprenyltransferase
MLHIALMGIPMHILFFPAVLVLVAWQGLFGMFITWRYTPKQLKKLSYLVHAQLFTGVMMGVFAYLGHVLIDD